MQLFLIILYFLTFFLCCLSYFIYPIILIFIGNKSNFNSSKKSFFPEISIIISAYNEENDIENKIKNTLLLDYPVEKVEILIGSDGSSDNTASIVKSLNIKPVKFFNFEKNRGKTAVQNDLVSMAKGDILVFTDAASYLPPDAIEKLIQNFADERVGCVAGTLRYVDINNNLITEGQGFYWKYEMKLRFLESSLGSLVGVDGPLYAVRKDLYIPLPLNIISDLVTPLLILAQNKKVILEPKAFVDEKPTIKSIDELNTRRRITLRGFIGVFYYFSVVNPVKNFFVTFQIILHKLLRWLVGPLVIVNVISLIGLYLLKSFYADKMLTIYLIFIILAIFGFALNKIDIKNKFFSIPYYFCVVNIAATMGFLDFLRNKQAITWKTIRD